MRLLGGLAVAVAGALASTGAAQAQTTTTIAPATVPTTVAKAAPIPPSKAAILVDVDTGRVLYEEADHVPLPPGSLTKVLTAMIADNWLTPDAQIPVTAADAAVYPVRVGMKAGQLWPFDITMHALLTDSANDAAYALAEYVGGSLDGFAKLMQQAAGQIGMQDNPIIEDPAGLDSTMGHQSGNRISAWDLAIAGRDMMANPYLASIALLRTWDFEGPDNIRYHLVSRNYHFLASYPGAIGVKTGFTDAAGFCDMEEAEQGGRKMLAVVLSSPNPDAVAAALMSEGFSTPVAAEPAVTLPDVKQPEPPPPPAPTTTTITTTPSTSPPAKRAEALRSLVGGKPGRDNYGWYATAAAMALTAAGMLASTLRTGRKRR